MPDVIKGKHRRWCFTWNNPPEDLTDFIAWLEDFKFVYGHEIGEEGTPHLQGFVEFNGGVTYTYVRKHAECWWTPANGDDASNWAYCTKSGDFVTSHPDGFPVKKPGRRTDIEIVKSIVEDGGGMRRVVDEVSSYQACKHAELYLKYKEAPRTTPTECIWIYGPSGAGKTQRAMELAGPGAWWAAESGQWFDGYDGHEVAVIDELRADTWKFVQLLRLLDSKPLRVPHKGGFRQWRPTLVIITTLRCPELTYGISAAEPIEQLKRRITKFIRLGNCPEVGGNKALCASPTCGGLDASAAPDSDKLLDELLAEFEN